MFHVREFLYPSNVLTLARLGLLPFTLYFLQRPERRRLAFVCMGLGMLTDAIDGPIARRRGEVSNLGQVLDPIADKLVLDSAAVMLSRTRQFPWWATTILLARDVTILVLGFQIYRRKAHITTAQSVGKITTVGMTAALLLYTIDGPRSGRPMLYIAAIPLLLSIWLYLRRFARVMRDQEAL